MWGTLRDREEEEILQGARERLPERYRRLLEQYYKGLGRKAARRAGTRDR